MRTSIAMSLDLPQHRIPTSGNPAVVIDRIVEAAEVTVIWMRAHVAPMQDADIYRVDDWGYTIERDDFGNHSSPHGWVIGWGEDEDGNPLDELRPVNVSRAAKN